MGSTVRPLSLSKSRFISNLSEAKELCPLRRSKEGWAGAHGRPGRTGHSWAHREARCGSACLLVSSVSGFRPDTKWTVEDTFFFFLGSLVQSHCGEGGMLQTNNTGVCSQCLSHTGPAPAHGACSLPAHTAQALGCSTGNHPWPALGCLHLPGPSHSGSGTWGVLRGTDLVGPAFHAIPRSEQLR